MKVLNYRSFSFTLEEIDGFFVASCEKLGKLFSDKSKYMAIMIMQAEIDNAMRRTIHETR